MQRENRLDRTLDAGHGNRLMKLSDFGTYRFVIRILQAQLRWLQEQLG
jgi:hypothetical protein